MITGVGIHIKTRDRVKVLDAVRAAMEADGLSWVGGGPDGSPNEAVRLLLLPPRGAWTSLYPEDPRQARALADNLAVGVGAPTLTVGRIEDAAFFYAAYDAKGQLVDEYHSCPDYEKEIGQKDASDEELERTRGKPDALSQLLGVGGGAVEELKKVLTDARVERLHDHDIYSGGLDNREPLTLLAKTFGLPDLLEEFDELWHLGVDEEEEVDLRYLAYGMPEESLRERLEEKWESLVDRLPRFGGTSSPSKVSEDEDPDDEEPEDDTPEGNADEDESGS